MAVAVADLQFEWPDGRVAAGRVEIGAPYASADSGWACRVTIDALQPGESPIWGEDSLQALTLATVFVRRRLQAFLEMGGQVRAVDGSSFPLDAYFPVS